MRTWLVRPVGLLIFPVIVFGFRGFLDHVAAGGHAIKRRRVGSCCTNCSSFKHSSIEKPDIEQEPATMIQHDQQSRWKAWMRMLAVEIRPISMSMLRKSTSLSIGVTKPG